MSDLNAFDRSPLGAFTRSRLGARNGCIKWKDPLVYFPFDGTYNETTGGGRTWAPSATELLVGPFGRGTFHVFIFALTPGSMSLPDDSVLNRPAGASGDFTLRCFVGYTIPSGADVGDQAFVLQKTADDLSGPGYAIILTNTGADSETMVFRLADSGGGSFDCPIAIPDPNPLDFGLHTGGGHLVIAYDSSANKVTTWWNLAKTETELGGFVPAESSESLKVSNYPDRFALNFDDLGIWDYVWPERTVRCDYRNGTWQFP